MSHPPLTPLHPDEALLIAAVFYWIITIIFSAFQDRLEARVARGERTIG